MSKQLPQKLFDYVMRMANLGMPFGDDKWNSSAQQLEAELKARGIKRKLFYKYKLPDSMTPQEFQDKLTLNAFMKNFFDSFSSKIVHDKNLTLREKLQIFAWVWKMRRNKPKRDMKYFMDEIKRLNPELADIKPRTARGLVYGALFGFAPDEIKYFCDETKLCDYVQAEEVTHTFAKHGIQLNYVLNPKTAESIINELKTKGK